MESGEWSEAPECARFPCVYRRDVEDAVPYKAMSYRAEDWRAAEGRPYVNSSLKQQAPAAGAAGAGFV